MTSWLACRCKLTPLLMAIFSVVRLLLGPHIRLRFFRAIPTNTCHRSRRGDTNRPSTGEGQRPRSAVVGLVCLVSQAHRGLLSTSHAAYRASTLLLNVL